MQYHVIMTKECNLRCNYCGGGSDTPPSEIQYSTSDLKSFISKDNNPLISFYGGEPLLRIKKVKEILDEIPSRFVLQTNGLFLNAIEQPYLDKLHTILVSIDGTRDVTDRERGNGVYDRVMQNVDTIRRSGFGGDLVARMTIAQNTDIYQNVRHLFGTGYFDHIHWQLNFAMFWQGYDDERTSLDEWITSYNSGISLLVDWWVEEMSRGEIIGLVPFNGIMNSLLSGEKSDLRCGSGIDFFSIMPDGRISACPVSIDYDFSIVGSIYDNSPLALGGKAKIGEPCLSCEVLNVCGGRCLLVNRAQEMLRKDGLSNICKTVKHLVNELKDSVPRVRSFIERGVIKESYFEYPGFNNGCEIIP